MTETAIVFSELKMAIKKIHSWAKPKQVFPSILNFPSSSKIYKESYGTVLLIAPWNYPFQLVFALLIGAIAANTVVVKPSELTPNTSKITKEIIEVVFDKNYITVVEGNASVSQELLAQRMGLYFFYRKYKCR